MDSKIPTFKFNNGEPPDSGEDEETGVEEAAPAPPLSDSEAEDEEEIQDLYVETDEKDDPAAMQKLADALSSDMQQAYRIVGKLMSAENHVHNWPFMNAVDPSGSLWDYAEVIPKPMWLKKVREKLLHGEYGTATEVFRDLRLMLRNCYRYNGPQHSVTRRALRLEELMETLVGQLEPSLRDVCTLEATEGADALVDPKIINRRRSSRAKTPGYFSHVLHGVRHERADREKEFRRQQLETKRQQRKEKENSIVDWERRLLAADVGHRLRASWELPQIAQFIHLSLRALNIFEVPLYELERMLLVPQSSDTLAMMMTSLVSSPLIRTKLDDLPPMPYHMWTEKLAARVQLWYRAYAKEAGRKERLLETQGIEPEFWSVVGEQNPFETMLFHQLSFYQRIWMVKTLCDYLFHNHKTIQECVMETSVEEPREAVLGRDRHGFEYIHFPHLYVQDVRLYRRRSWSARDDAAAPACAASLAMLAAPPLQSTELGRWTKARVEKLRRKLTQMRTGGAGGSAGRGRRRHTCLAAGGATPAGSDAECAEDVPVGRAAEELLNTTDDEDTDGEGFSPRKRSHKKGARSAAETPRKKRKKKKTKAASSRNSTPMRGSRESAAAPVPADPNVCPYCAMSIRSGRARNAHRCFLEAQAGGTPASAVAVDSDSAAERLYDSEDDSDLAKPVTPRSTRGRKSRGSRRGRTRTSARNTETNNTVETAADEAPRSTRGRKRVGKTGRRGRPPKNATVARRVVEESASASETEANDVASRLSAVTDEQSRDADFSARGSRASSRSRANSPACVNTRGTRASARAARKLKLDERESPPGSTRSSRASSRTARNSAPESQEISVSPPPVLNADGLTTDENSTTLGLVSDGIPSSVTSEPPPALTPVKNNVNRASNGPAGDGIKMSESNGDSLKGENYNQEAREGMEVDGESNSNEKIKIKQEEQKGADMYMEDGEITSRATEDEPVENGVSSDGGGQDTQSNNQAIGLTDRSISNVKSVLVDDNAPSDTSAESEARTRFNQDKKFRPGPGINPEMEEVSKSDNCSEGQGWDSDEKLLKQTQKFGPEQDLESGISEVRDQSERQIDSSKLDDEGTGSVQANSAEPTEDRSTQSNASAVSSGSSNYVNTCTEEADVKSLETLDYEASTGDSKSTGKAFIEESKRDSIKEEKAASDQVQSSHVSKMDLNDDNCKARQGSNHSDVGESSVDCVAEVKTESSEATELESTSKPLKIEPGATPVKSEPRDEFETDAVPSHPPTIANAKTAVKQKLLESKPLVKSDAVENDDSDELSEGDDGPCKELNVPDAVVDPENVPGPDADKFQLVADTFDGLRRLIDSFDPETNKKPPPCEVELHAALLEILEELEPLESKINQSVRRMRKRLCQEWLNYIERPADYIDPYEEAWRDSGDEAEAVSKPAKSPEPSPEPSETEEVFDADGRRKQRSRRAKRKRVNYCVDGVGAQTSDPRDKDYDEWQVSSRGRMRKVRKMEDYAYDPESGDENSGASAASSAQQPPGPDEQKHRPEKSRPAQGKVKVERVVVSKQSEDSVWENFRQQMFQREKQTAATPRGGRPVPITEPSPAWNSELNMLSENLQDRVQRIGSAVQSRIQQSRRVVKPMTTSSAGAGSPFTTLQRTVTGRPRPIGQRVVVSTTSLLPGARGLTKVVYTNSDPSSFVLRMTKDGKTVMAKVDDAATAGGATSSSAQREAALSQIDRPISLGSAVGSFTTTSKPGTPARSATAAGNVVLMLQCRDRDTGETRLMQLSPERANSFLSNLNIPAAKAPSGASTVTTVNAVAVPVSTQSSALADPTISNNVETASEQSEIKPTLAQPLGQAQPVSSTETGAQPKSQALIASHVPAGARSRPVYQQGSVLARHIQSLPVPTSMPMLERHATIATTTAAATVRAVHVGSTYVSPDVATRMKSIIQRTTGMSGRQTNQAAPVAASNAQSAGGSGQSPAKNSMSTKMQLQSRPVLQHENVPLQTGAPLSQPISSEHLASVVASPRALSPRKPQLIRPMPAAVRLGASPLSAAGRAALQTAASQRVAVVPDLLAVSAQETVTQGQVVATGQGQIRSIVPLVHPEGASPSQALFTNTRPLLVSDLSTVQNVDVLTASVAAVRHPQASQARRPVKLPAQKTTMVLPQSQRVAQPQFLLSAHQQSPSTPPRHVSHQLVVSSPQTLAPQQLLIAGSQPILTAQPQQVIAVQNVVSAQPQVVFSAQEASTARGGAQVVSVQPQTVITQQPQVISSQSPVVAHSQSQLVGAQPVSVVQSPVKTQHVAAAAAAATVHSQPQLTGFDALLASPQRRPMKASRVVTSSPLRAAAAGRPSVLTTGPQSQPASTDPTSAAPSYGTTFSSPVAAGAGVVVRPRISAGRGLPTVHVRGVVRPPPMLRAPRYMSPTAQVAASPATLASAAPAPAGPPAPPLITEPTQGKIVVIKSGNEQKLGVLMADGNVVALSDQQMNSVKMEAAKCSLPSTEADVIVSE